MGAAYLKGAAVVGLHLLAPASCSGKEQFATPSLAVAVAARTRVGVRTHYRCRFCGFWHVGRSAAQRQKSVMNYRLVRGES